MGARRVVIDSVSAGHSLEATPGFEPGMRALQAPALPLGHVAIWWAAIGRFNSETGRTFGLKRPCPHRSARGAMERKTGLEPAPPTLARLCSTN